MFPVSVSPEEVRPAQAHLPGGGIREGGVPPEPPPNDAAAGRRQHAGDRRLLRQAGAGPQGIGSLPRQHDQTPHQTLPGEAATSTSPLERNEKDKHVTVREGLTNWGATNLKSRSTIK